MRSRRELKWHEKSLKSLAIEFFSQGENQIIAVVLLAITIFWIIL